MKAELSFLDATDQPSPFIIDDPTDWTFLKRTLAAGCGVTCLDHLHVHYWDGEDSVAIGSQEEWEEALRIAESEPCIPLIIDKAKSDDCNACQLYPAEASFLSTLVKFAVVKDSAEKTLRDTEGSTDTGSMQHSSLNDDTSAMDQKEEKPSSSKKSHKTGEATDVDTNTEPSLMEYKLLDYKLSDAATDLREKARRQSMAAAAFASVWEMEMEAGGISFDEGLEVEEVSEEESADQKHVMLPGALSGANVIAIEMPEMEHQGTETAEPAEIAETGEVSTKSSRDAETGFWMQQRFDAEAEEEERRKLSSPLPMRQRTSFSPPQQKKQERKSVMLDSSQKKKKPSVEINFMTKKREKVKSSSTNTSSSLLETPSEEVSSDAPPSSFSKKHERRSSKSESGAKKKKDRFDPLTEDVFVRYMTKFESQLKKDMAKEVAKKTVRSVIKNLPKQNEEGDNTHAQPAISSKGSGFVHEDIICDCCDREIVGTRYICGNCTNYDLCEECENIQPSFHDRKHVFIKLRRPCLKAGTRHGVRVSLLKRIIYDRKEEERKVDPERIQVIMERTKAQGNQQWERHMGRNSNNNEGEEPSDHSDAREMDKLRFGLEKPSDEYQAEFIDAGISSACVSPREWVRKYWVVENTGTATWSNNIKLIRVCGMMPVEKAFVPVKPLEPGQRTVVTVSMASLDEGEYKTFWQLYDDGWFGPMICSSARVKKTDCDVKPLLLQTAATPVPEARVNDLLEPFPIPFPGTSFPYPGERFYSYSGSTRCSDTRATGSPESIATSLSDVPPEMNIFHSEPNSNNIPLEKAAQTNESVKYEEVMQALCGRSWLMEEVADEDCEEQLNQTGGVLPQGDGADPEQTEDDFVLCTFTHPVSGEEVCAHRETSPASSIEVMDKDHTEMQQTELGSSQLLQEMVLNLAADYRSGCRREALEEEAAKGDSSFSSLLDESSSDEEFVIILPDCFDTSKPLNFKAWTQVACQKTESPHSPDSKQKDTCSDTTPAVLGDQSPEVDTLNTSGSSGEEQTLETVMGDTSHQLDEDTHQVPCDEILDVTDLEASPGNDDSTQAVTIPQSDFMDVAEEAEVENDQDDEEADKQEEGCSAVPAAQTDTLTRAESSSDEACAAPDHSLEQEGSPPEQDPETPEAKDDETDLKHYSESEDEGAAAAAEAADSVLEPNQQLNQMVTNTLKKAGSGLQHLYEAGKGIFKTLQLGDSYEHKESTYEFKPSTYRLPESTWQPSNKEYVPPKSDFKLKSSEYQLPQSTFTGPPSQMPAGVGIGREFAVPLQRVREMGYFNNECTLALLRKYEGDIQKVVNDLIEETDNDWAESRHGN